jgi:hypothetical protein
VNVPRPVDAFFRDALAKEPQQRPDGPYSVATQLRQAIDGSRRGYSGQAAGAAGAHRGASQADQPQQQPPNQPQQQPPNQPAQQQGGNQPGQRPAGGGQRGQQPGTAGEQARRQPEQLSDRTEERRRTVLKAGLGATILGLLGFGAFQFLDDGSNETTAERNVLDTVPPKADLVAHTNATTLLSNSEFTDAINQQLATQTDSEYGSLSELLDGVQSTTGIDFRQVEDVTGFWGTAQSTNYAAMIVQSPADESTVQERLANEGVVESETTYRDRPLYLLSSAEFIWDLYLSHLGDGEYALGTRQEIEDIIDVREGDLDRVGSDVRNAYRQSAAEPVRWGFIVPSGLVSELDSLPGATQLVADLDAGYGTLREDPSGEFRLTVETTSDSIASDFESQLNTLVMLANNQLESTNALNLSDATAQQLQQVITDLETETDGANVILTVPDGFRLVPIVFEVVFQ